MIIEFTNQARKELKKLIKKNKNLVSEINSEIESIKENNFEGKGDFNNLSIYRTKINNVPYRIIYNIENNVNKIYRIGTRQNFYKE